MHLRLNKYERVAGVFVLLAMAGMFFFVLNVMWHQGWFQAKVSYTTSITSSEGIQIGSAVEMAGVPIGKVESIKFAGRNKIDIGVSILKSYQEHVRQDSGFQLVRRGLLGDKMLLLSMGDPSLPMLGAGSRLETEELPGLVELVNGRSLGPYIKTLQQVFAEMKELTDMLLKQKGSAKYLSALENFKNLVGNISSMSQEVTKLGRQMNDGERVKITLRNVASISEKWSAALPALAESAPNLGKDFADIVTNLAVLTTELKKVLPALSEIAPELPKTSRRMVEAIDEAVVTLKAMQRSFLLSGSAKDVRKEEAAAAAAKEEEKKKALEKKEEKLEPSAVPVP